MNTSARLRDIGGGLRGFGVTKGPTPNRNTRQPVEDDKKALIHVWEQREREINAVLISAGAISLGVIWRIVNNIRSLEASNKPIYYQRLYAAALALMSQTQKTSSSAAIPQDLVPSILSQHYFESGSELSLSQVLHMNMYWIATLVFTISTVFLAMLSRQRSRDVKLGLIHQQLGDHASKSAAIAADVSLDGCVQVLYMSPVIDTMYRLFQVALVLFLLGHVDAVVAPIGATYLTLIVVCGTFYTFRVFRQT